LAGPNCHFSFFTCVVVNPGWVKTDMGGPQATLTPQDSVSAHAYFSG